MPVIPTVFQIEDVLHPLRDRVEYASAACGQLSKYGDHGGAAQSDGRSGSISFEVCSEDRPVVGIQEADRRYTR